MTITPAFVHERTGLASLIQLERMRSDRSGVPFSLAVFQFSSSETAECFADGLSNRARATDHAGWMTRTRVGVLLWNTVADGAWQFVDEMVQRTECQPEGTDVFVYRGTGQPAGDAQRPVPRSFPRDDSAADDSVVGGRGGDGTISVPTAVRTVTGAESATTERIRQTLHLTEQLMEELLDTHSLPPRASRHSQPLTDLCAMPMPLWKRTIDIVGALVGLIVLFPLFIGVALAIKLTSPGPVFFSQMRSGRGGRPFPMFKFRSMVVDAEQQQQELMAQNEQDGPAFKIEHDPRITRVGYLIRRTSIDELPQLWNVLRGDMSIVGPRPLPCRETEGCQSWQKRRLDATPGLTCIWQVQDRRTRIPFAEWARMDIRYMRSRTLRHDAKLVLQTLRSIFGGKGS